MHTVIGYLSTKVVDTYTRHDFSHKPTSVAEDVSNDELLSTANYCESETDDAS